MKSWQCFRGGQSLKPMPDLLLLCRLPPGPLGIYSAGTEFPGVSHWFCLPSLDPVLRAL